MATASSVSGKGRKNAFDAVAAGQTDSVLVAAVNGSRIRVHAFIITGASAVTFNTKGSGAGTAIFPPLGGVAGNVIPVPENAAGWFQTGSGEGLTVTTGAGSTTSIAVSYSLV